MPRNLLRKVEIIVVAEGGIADLAGVFTNGLAANACYDHCIIEHGCEVDPETDDAPDDSDTYLASDGHRYYMHTDDWDIWHFVCGVDSEFDPAAFNQKHFYDEN